MKRRLLYIAAVASLLLCVALSGLVILSYWRMQSLQFTRQDGPSMVVTNLYATRGGIRYTHVRSTPLTPSITLSTNSGVRWLDMADRRPYPLRIGWRHSENTRNGVRSRRWDFALPMWPLNLLTLILPGVAYRRYRRQRLHRQRAAAGQCVQCGYDIHATPQRCPECGHAAAAA